jgi:hypothetical protein
MYLCIVIYFCYLKFVHDLSNDASSSSEYKYTNSVDNLIAEEFMTRDKMCARMQCCPDTRYHSSIQFDGSRKIMKNRCKVSGLRHNVWIWETPYTDYVTRPKNDEAGLLLWETAGL